MIEYGYNIADHTARTPEDARVISDPGRYQQVALDRGAGLAGLAKCPLRAMNRRCRQTDAHARGL